jgi:hypothetical protein
MHPFIQAHEGTIHGVVGCFDRMLFRGFLPIQWGGGMAGFLWKQDVPFRDLKEYLPKQAEVIKKHAFQLAAEHHRPFRHLTGPIAKDAEARVIAERDGVTDGLVCVFSTVEPCRTFRFGRKPDGKPVAQSTRRQCLFIYYYFLDPDFGLIHVKIQTWFPLQIQIYLNGHDWLARQLAAKGMKYSKADNVFVRLEDPVRAQEISDTFVSLDWPHILDRYAHLVNPFLKTTLNGYSYYWTTAQSEYSTDVMFKSAEDLRELAPRLMHHSTLYLGAREVMGFLGRKLHGKFEGEITNSLSDLLHQRIPGLRVKHRVKQNWLKM